MPESNEVNEMIAYLVDEGALVPSGMYGDDFTYSINVPVMKEIAPFIYEMFIEEFNESLLQLVEMGLVSVEYDGNLNAGFKITDAGRKVLEANGIFNEGDPPFPFAIG